jgi:caffeoyl-CoA O-methyltransferase
VAKMNITEPGIMEYVARVAPAPDPILQEMAARAEERGFPYIGPHVGRLLYAIVSMTGAERIFELGSGFGYSLYWMAKAAPDGAQLIGTEYDDDNVRAAAGFFKRGEIEDKAQVWHGDGLDLFRSLHGKFDIIVNDADKKQYCEIFKMAAPRLNPGGLFISDNVLWNGRVLDESADESTRAIQEYNELIFSDPRFFSLILPIRDGISISIKERD